MIGVRVVAVVLVDPPAVAEPDAEVAAHDPDDVVGPPGAEDLLVPGVVAEEADLGEHHRQERRDSQLPPGVAHQHERRAPGGGHHRQHQDPEEV